MRNSRHSKRSIFRTRLSDSKLEIITKSVYDGNGRGNLVIKDIKATEDGSTCFPRTWFRKRDVNTSRRRSFTNPLTRNQSFTSESSVRSRQSMNTREDVFRPLETIHRECAGDGDNDSRR